MSKFLPEGYDKIPSNSRYMKLQDGENTFRVLSSAVTGWLYWNSSNEPVRSKERWDEIPHDIRIESDGKQSKVKHFWAFVVWNYGEKMVQILEITQAQIQTGMKSLVDSKHWGDPKNYDIAISRAGSGFDTEYVVQGIPPKPLDPKIAAEYQKFKIDLNALFAGGDPFDPSAAVRVTAPEEAVVVDEPGFPEPVIDRTLESGVPIPEEPPHLKHIPDQFKKKTA
jgi:hypothetical protein